MSKLGWKCVVCGLTANIRREDFPVHCCGVTHTLDGGEEWPAANYLPPPPEEQLRPAELAELQRTDPSLAGNRLEAMLKAVGVPTCRGCEKRREWLNRCHQWLRG